MDFKTFQEHCKYAAWGLKQDTVRDFELTCRNPKCVPSGRSWGACDKAHCPHFGIKVTNVMAIDPETGETIPIFDEGRVIFGN